MPLEYYFMLAGLVLLLIEFVVPGFGIFGVSGMVCLTVGGFYVLGGNAWAALVLLAVYLFLVLVITLLCVYLPKESKYNPFVLWTRQKKQRGLHRRQKLEHAGGQKRHSLDYAASCRHNSGGRQAS